MDPLNKLYVEVTSRCNLNCQMCVQRVWNTAPGNMPVATFDALMDSLADVPSPPIIHLGGYGEPLHHPAILTLLERAKMTGARVEMTTNGTLLTPTIADALLDLDLDRLVVSIDGVTSDSYGNTRTNGSLTQVMDNLSELHRRRLRRGTRHSNPQIEIAFVAMKRNIDDLPELPRLATRIGAWKINVSNVVPHTPEMEHEILYSQALTSCAYRETRWAVNTRLPKLDFDDHTLNPLERLWSARSSITWLGTSLSARNDYCEFSQEGYTAVRSDGNVSPCLSLLYDHPEYIRGRRKQITHHTFGNINVQPLPAIWMSPDYVAFREQLRDFQFSPCTTCGGCERFAENYEDCTENTFPTCGGCLWAQGFITCP